MILMYVSRGDERFSDVDTDARQLWLQGILAQGDFEVLQINHIDFHYLHTEPISHL